MNAHSSLNDEDKIQSMHRMLEAMQAQLIELRGAAPQFIRREGEPETARALVITRTSPGRYGYVNVANRFYKERMRRAAFFHSDLFGEPAWNILLDLFRYSDTGKQISITSACIASGVPSTTALRWVNVLIEQGLVVRCGDPIDRRRAFLQLTKPALLSLDQYFKAIDFDRADR